MSDSLLPHNATRQERALDAVTGPAMAPAVLLRAVWDPDSCPSELLPWLAFAFSVDVWNPEWPEETKREVIRRSFEVHRQKGTRKAVETALAAVGFNTDLSEWFEHGGDPHTFRIDVFGKDIFDAGYQIDAGLLARVSQVIETVKPARSHFTLRIGDHVRVSGQLRLGVNERHRERGRIAPKPRIHIADPAAYARLGVRDAHREYGTLTPNPRTHTASIGAVTRLGIRDRAVMSTEFKIIPRYGAAYAR